MRAGAMACDPPAINIPPSLRDCTALFCTRGHRQTLGDRMSRSAVRVERKNHIHISTCAILGDTFVTHVNYLLLVAWNIRKSHES